MEDCLKQAKAHGFRLLQFNAVVKSNVKALKLYKKMGFIQLGTIPGGFRNKEGVYEDIVLHKLYPFVCHRRKPTTFRWWEESCESLAINPDYQYTFV